MSSLGFARRIVSLLLLELAACGGDAGPSLTGESVDFSGINQPNVVRNMGFAPDGGLLVSAYYGAGTSFDTYANYDSLQYDFATKTWSVFGPPSRCFGLGPRDTTYFCNVVTENGTEIGTVVQQTVQRQTEGGTLELLADDPALPTILNADAEGNLYAQTSGSLSVKLRAETTFTPVTPSIPDQAVALFVSQDGATTLAFVGGRALYRSISATAFEQIIDFTTLENARLSGLTPAAFSTDGTFYLYEPSKRELWKLAPGGNQIVQVTTVPYGFVLNSVMVDRSNNVYVVVRLNDGSTTQRSGEMYEYNGGSDWTLRVRYGDNVTSPIIGPDGDAYLVGFQNGRVTDISRFRR